jgi:hypothetical protein
MYLGTYGHIYVHNKKRYLIEIKEIIEIKLQNPWYCSLLTWHSPNLHLLQNTWAGWIDDESHLESRTP